MQPWVRNMAIAIATLMPLMSAAQDDPQTAERPAVFVQTMQIESGEATLARQFFGQIAALETVDMSFEVGGYIAALDAREGQAIKKGTVLAGLDLAPFERAVERATLSLAQADRDLARAQTLATRNVASEVRAKDAQTARDLADVALREAEDALEDARLLAPFDGLIAERIGTPFTTIEPGTPILRLHNMSEIRVEFDLPERVLAKIGDPVAVTFTGLIAGSDEPLELIYREFQTATDGIGQSYTVSLAVQDTGGRTLLPGRTVIVHASVPLTSPAVAVPATAIATLPGGQQVVVAVDKTDQSLTARHIPVDVRSEDGTGFTVEGLEAGTEIIAIGAHLIEDGQPIKRFTGLTVEGL